MSWSISASGSLEDVRKQINASQPPGGSTPSAVQHFMNHKTLIESELVRIEEDMKNDPSGKQGVSISASGHHDEKNRNASCRVERADLHKSATKAVPKKNKDEDDE